LKQNLIFRQLEIHINSTPYMPAVSAEQNFHCKGYSCDALGARQLS
jgi:hypothetical protein